jgi:hypothetical protein
MDREWGSKPGSGGAASAQNEAIDRRERLRRLALETIDLAKDPYFMRNHLGRYPTLSLSLSLSLSVCIFDLGFLVLMFWLRGFVAVMSASFAWHSTTTRGITWPTHRESVTRLIWPRELPARQRKRLRSLSPTSARSPFASQASAFFFFLFPSSLGLFFDPNPTETTFLCFFFY